MIDKKAAAQGFGVHYKTFEKWIKDPQFAKSIGAERHSRTGHLFFDLELCKGKAEFDVSRIVVEDQAPAPAPASSAPAPAKRKAAAAEQKKRFVSVRLASEITGLPVFVIRHAFAYRFSSRLIVDLKEIESTEIQQIHRRCFDETSTRLDFFDVEFGKRGVHPYVIKKETKKNA